MPTADIRDNVGMRNTGWLITGREKVFALSGNLLLSQSFTTNHTPTWIIVDHSGTKHEYLQRRNTWVVE
jgi:hypothetical protein